MQIISSSGGIHDHPKEGIEKTLTNKLLQGYNMYARPRLRLDEPVTVLVDVVILQIEDIVSHDVQFSWYKKISHSVDSWFEKNYLISHEQFLYISGKNQDKMPSVKFENIKSIPKYFGQFISRMKNTRF